MFRDGLPGNLLLPVSEVVTKFTFIGVILEGTIPLHGKNNLQYLYIHWDNIRSY